jgi:hypothetical protein
VSSRKAADPNRAPIIPPAGAWLKIPASPPPPRKGNPEPFQVLSIPGALRGGVLFLRFLTFILVLILGPEPPQQDIYRRDSQKDPDQLHGGHGSPIGTEAQTHRTHLGQAARSGGEHGRDGVDGGKGSGDEGSGDPGRG